MSCLIWLLTWWKQLGGTWSSRVLFSFTIQAQVPEEGIEAEECSVGRKLLSWRNQCEWLPKAISYLVSIIRSGWTGKEMTAANTRALWSWTLCTSGQVTWPLAFQRLATNASPYARVCSLHPLFFLPFFLKKMWHITVLKILLMQILFPDHWVNLDMSRS